MAGRRTATILKIRNGSAAHNPSLVRDESRITPKGKPIVPPWITLDEDRQQMFDFLVAEFVIPGVHGRPDGLLMMQLVEQLMMNRNAVEKIKAVGVLMRSKDGQPILQPLYKVQRDTSAQIVRLMFDLGFSPGGRLKFAPPMSGQPQHHVATWDDIDS